MAHPSETGRNDGLTALLVDEDEDLRVYLRRCLEQFRPLFGRVLEASSGSEGLSVARFNTVDVLICGSQLTHMSCASLFRAIRSDAATESMLIMLVAHEKGESGDSPNSPERLADAVLTLPFNAAGFATRLAELLRPSNRLNTDEHRPITRREPRDST